MKKIAIVASSSGNHIGVPKTYYGLIRTLKANPVIIEPNMSERRVDSIIKDISLLMLPGGADLSPHLYGQDPEPFTGNPDLHKENFFVRHLSKYIAGGVPVFGICLGFQMLNVKFGGTLTQHINSSVHQEDRRAYEAHEVVTSKGNIFGVNSHHHQAVKSEDLSKEMEVLAVSDEYQKKLTPSFVPFRNDDTIIEAFKHKSLPVAGVQWHPEEWYDSFSLDLIRSIWR
jgi:putative glutamine amidotransferase